MNEILVKIREIFNLFQEKVSQYDKLAKERDEKLSLRAIELETREAEVSEREKKVGAIENVRELKMQNVLERKGIDHYSKTLSSLYLKLKKTNLADNILYTLGKRLSTQEKTGTIHLFDKSLSYLNASWLCFKTLLKAHPNSSLRDDAIYDGSKALHRLGRTKEAITLLSSFFKGKSTSWFFGEYNSHLMDDAWLLSASLYLELGNFTKGFSMLMALAKEFPTSRLRDDAHYLAIISAFRARKTALACKAVASFLKMYKRSRHFGAVSRQRAKCVRTP